MKLKQLTLLVPCLLTVTVLHGQRFLNSGYVVKVVPDQAMVINFDRPIRPWHGFGVNYVEACQTRDYQLFGQDYSGFSFASEATKQQILEMVFGPDGLRPGLTKLFLDPFHEGLTVEGNDNQDPFNINLEAYDHETTTKNMRYFNREGIKLMNTWGGKLQAITTLYGPAPWMTKQKWILGRDLDPDLKPEVAEYMASWAMYLIEKEGIPVKYISFHNEGDAYYRWPRDGGNPGEDHRDYNSYWTPDQVVEFLKITRKVLDINGLEEVGLSPGETQNWYRFDQWGYASAIVHDKEALKNLAIITSHSFAFLDEPQSVYYGDYRSIGQDLIHRYQPDVPVWVTSHPWGDGPDLIESIRRHIYESKANGVIPWALIAGANQWLESDHKYSDGSMKTAFHISEDGNLTVNDKYYYYKQVTRAGQPGDHVVEVINFDPALGAIAFKGSQDAFVVINKSEKDKEITITINGSSAVEFEAFRTSESENYQNLENVKVTAGSLKYIAPKRSVTTFFSEE